MRKKRNRKRGQNSSESTSNMSVASTVDHRDISHDHSCHAISAETNLSHKEHRAKSISNSNTKSCRPKDPKGLKANIQRELDPVLHNGCNDIDHCDLAVSNLSTTLEMKSDDSNLYDKANAESQTLDSGYISSNSSSNKSFHQRQETSTSKSNSEVNEPISELTKLVEDIDIQNDFVTRGAGLQEDISGTLMKGGDEDDDEMLEEFGAVGSATNQLLENEEPSLEELPTSLSDFVLGYRNDSYPIPPVPPNDDDIDIIKVEGSEHDISLVPYESELQMPDIMRLITKDLSEPYSIYTYRYFIHNWPQLCFLVS